jgi:hypothetical protein
MTQPTVLVRTAGGLRPVAINTDAKEVTLVGSWTREGDPVNTRQATVYRNKRYARWAARLSHYLGTVETKPGYFEVINGQES